MHTVAFYGYHGGPVVETFNHLQAATWVAHKWGLIRGQKAVLTDANGLKRTYGSLLDIEV